VQHLFAMPDDLEQGVSSITQTFISNVKNVFQRLSHAISASSATKAIPRACRPAFALGLTVSVVVIWWLIRNIHAYYIFVRYGFQWFEESLPSASEVAGEA